MKDPSDANYDLLVFSDEPAPKKADSGEKWKILVIDDDQSVHTVTRMILGDFTFQNKGLEIISAYSDDEAYELIRQTDNIAVILLDVVMAKEDSGLRMVKFIRDDLQNKMTRIVLRTGQPGHAPEKTVIVDYDINDYKLKTELTADKLFVTMVAALRAYSDLRTIENNRKGLEKIIESSSSLFKPQSFGDFVSGVLIQMTSLMHLGHNAMYCRTSGLSASRNGSSFVIEAGIGDFLGSVRKSIEETLSPDTLAVIHEAIREKRSAYLAKSFIAYFMGTGGRENIIYMESSRDISAWDKNLIEIFCTNISVALDNMALTEEIENTQKEIIYTLGEVAEARSRETGHHVKRVAEYSKVLALKYGLGETEAETIRLASPMHDVGKLAIPDAILNKPGPLTDGEYDVIKTHARAGFDMLKNSNREIMKVAALIALEHQEKWDGTGYPSGKKGKEISLPGRIVAIADVFDALGCDRIYKKAWSMEEILAYFREQRGRHFDPELTDTFISIIDEIESIRQNIPD